MVVVLNEAAEAASEDPAKNAYIAEIRNRIPKLLWLTIGSVLLLVYALLRLTSGG